jgi:hypothetical protein
MRLHNQDFNQAIRELASITGIEVPDPTGKQEGKRGRPRIFPELTEEQVTKMHEALPDEERRYLRGRGISDEIIDKFQIGFWIDHHRNDMLVFPVRKSGKLHNLRFYRKATDREDKQIRQLSRKSLGHDPIWLFPEPDPDCEDIHIKEGEIDALCACSLGLNATTATGGAGTWREEFNQFFRGKKTWICYDIDDKGRIGAKAVAKQVANEAKETRIIYLDLDKKKYERGDFNDYIVKEGKTLDDFRKLMDDASFEVALDRDVRVVEDGNAYWSVKTNRKGEVELNKISNFALRLVCRYIRDEGTMVREVFLVNDKTAKKSDRTILDPDQMASLRMFKSFCLASGDFVFEGDERDMIDIWYLLAAQDPDAKVVRQVHQVGYLSSHDIWLFDNVAIKKGQPIMADNRGIYWNGQMGYTFTPFDSGGTDVIKHLPTLIVSDNEDTQEYVNQLCDVMVKNIGSYDVLLGLGLAFGSIYFRDIVSHTSLGCFPILFVYGSLKSGKTEYVSFLMRLFGLEKSDSESLPAITSTVPISRRLAYFSNIPVWWDEYRDNNPRVNAIVGVLRGAFDGSGRSIGVKGPRGVISERVQAPAFVSGEHLPSDEAFRSRLIPIHMRQSGKDHKLHKDVLRLSRNSSAHVFNLIKNKTPATTKRLIERIMSYKESIRLSRKDVQDERIIKNYAIALGCYSELANPEDELLPDHVMRGSGLNPLDYEEEPDEDQFATRSLIEFCDFVQEAIESKIIRSNVDWYHLCPDEDKVYIWLTPVYNAFAERYSRTRNEKPPNIATVKNWFRDLACFVEGSKNHRIPTSDGLRSIVKKCLVLRYRNLSKKLVGWFENYETYGYTSEHPPEEDSNKQGDIPF